MTTTTDFDNSTIKYEHPKAKTGFRYISLSTDSGKIRFNLPPLKVTFNTSVNEYGSAQLCLTVPELDEDLANFVKETDDYMFGIALKHNWFNSKEEYALAPSLVGGSKYDPYFKPKLNNTPLTTLTQNGETIKVNTLKDLCAKLSRGVVVSSVVELSGLWINKVKGVTTAGLTWKVVSVNLEQSVDQTDIPRESVGNEDDDDSWLGV